MMSEMILSLEFDKIPGFSRLFCDYIKNEQFISERMSNEIQLLQNTKLIDEKLKSYSKRNLFSELIRKSNLEIDLSEKQIENLSLLSKENTLVVVTGQQPAIFGGTLYTLYKSLSAIELAKQLKVRFPDFNFVPIFWIEDNDHDYFEATQVFLFDRQYNPISPQLNHSNQDILRKCICDITIDSAITEFLEFYIEANNFSSLQPHFSLEILNFYKKSRYLATAFQKILNLVVGKEGMLFISSSICRQNNAFADILRKELENPGASNEIIEQANRKIERFGYHIQVKSSPVNVFYHSNGERIKIQLNGETQKYKIKNQYFTALELLQLFSKNPFNFSPNVLLRQICQDHILPNIASIHGPSEIGYTTQLKEMYQWFDVVMPAIIPRHSITFLPKKFQEYIENYGFDFFFKPPETFDSILYEQNRDKNLKESIQALELRFQSVFDEMKQIASKVDITLLASSEAHSKKSFRAFESLKDKIFSNERKTILNKLSHLRSINKIIFPKGTLQERMIASIYPLLEYGQSDFIEIINQVFKQPRNKHYIVLI